jgi:uncharacterized repeat protein (TIGR01451 family)
LVAIDSNGITIDTMSCANGFYYEALGSVGDVYRFHVIAMPSAFSFYCPASGEIFDTIYSSIYCKEPRYFGLSCDSIHRFDIGTLLSIKGTGRHAQEGAIYAFNNFCPLTAGTVTLNHSPKYRLHNANPTPASSTSHSITWNVSDLTSTSDSPTPLYYHLEVPGAWLLPRDTTLTTVTITPSVGDLDSTNNFVVKIDTVKSSYDPNNILVAPEYHTISGAKLQYTINFENTGNDTAFNIHVMDTLSNDLDISSFEVIGSSHSMFVSKHKDRLGRNVLKFDFPDINLLDSSYHALCHGMLRYTIHSKPGLPECHVFQNRAGIYFDVNEVVMTNTVFNIIGCLPSLAVEELDTKLVSIFPNPATDEVTVKVSYDGAKTIVISNSIGQDVLIQPLSTHEETIKIKSLQPGLYYLTIEGLFGKIVRKIIKT